MKKSLLLAIVAASAAPCPLWASATRIAATASARDFLAGEAKGTAVTAEGRLSLGAPLSARAWPEDAADAVVFGAAADATGRVFVATGGGLGRLFVAEGAGAARVRPVFVAPEPNVTAVAVAPDGSVVCATSPNGKVYRVDPKARDAAAAGTVIGEPGEAAIWALAFGKDGTLYAGTGNKGRIYRLPAGTTGRMDLFHEIEDVHVRALAAGADGTIYAGTSDRGLLVAIAPGGSARTLHDFSKPEVVGIALDGKGNVYAAASLVEAPRLSGPPSRSGPGLTPTPAPGTSVPSVSDEEAPRGSVSVSSRTSRTPSAPASGREGSAEILVVQPDGFVEPAWSFPEETVYSLRTDSGGSLILSTGPKGRVYSWTNRHLLLLAQTGEKQAVAALSLGAGIAVVTNGSAGVFLPAPGTAEGSFTSAVRDASRLSSFGRLRFEGDVPAGSTARFAIRSGNSEKADGTWSPWIALGPDGAPAGGSKVPSARYFQWKADLKAGPKGETPSLERVEFSYAERNARPVLENVAVLEPGAVFSRGSGGLGVLSVTNPDENGIYAGLEAPRDGAGDIGPGKKLYRKAFRTVTWKCTDPNGDSLRYDLEARREAGGPWFPVRRDLEDPFYSFDTTSLPDGRYRVRVTASDRLSNAEGEALLATEDSGVLVIDNTPPVLKIETKKTDGANVEIRVLATDALSPVMKAEGSVNADRWRLVPAEDGAADSVSERFVFRVPKPVKAAIISLRVVDASGNAAAIALEWPKDFE